MDVRKEAKLEIWERWRSQLLEEDTVRPHRAVRAVLPKWKEWRDRGGVPLTFRTTQVLTGHGVFGEYLLKFRREVTSTCHHWRRRKTRRSTRWRFVRRGRYRGASYDSKLARDWPPKRSSRLCSGSARNTSPSAPTASK